MRATVLHDWRLAEFVDAKPGTWRTNYKVICRFSLQSSIVFKGQLYTINMCQWPPSELTMAPVRNFLRVISQAKKKNYSPYVQGSSKVYLLCTQKHQTQGLKWSSKCPWDCVSRIVDAKNLGTESDARRYCSLGILSKGIRRHWWLSSLKQEGRLLRKSSWVKINLN